MRAFNHLLGECGVTFFGTDELSRRYRKDFPESLNGAPFLMPSGNAALRRSLDQWFDTLGIRPKIRREFSDSALLKAFGQFGDGVFATHSAVEDDFKRMYRVAVVGRDDSLRERFYAVHREKTQASCRGCNLGVGTNKTVSGVKSLDPNGVSLLNRFQAGAIQQLTKS